MKGEDGEEVFEGLIGTCWINYLLYEEYLIGILRKEKRLKEGNGCYEGR